MTHACKKHMRFRSANMIAQPAQRFTEQTHSISYCMAMIMELLVISNSRPCADESNVVCVMLGTLFFIHRLTVGFTGRHSYIIVQDPLQLLGLLLCAAVYVGKMLTCAL